MPKKERSPAQKMATYRNSCRELWKKSPMYWAARERDWRGAGLAECQRCHKVIDQRLTKMDHIEPIIAPGQDPLDAALWASRLNCPASGLQTLCDPCNGTKTGKENSQRRKRGTNES